jgi:uncharacterized delta-60 repeat protein
MLMSIAGAKWFRGLLLASIYILGVLGILGSGGGGDGEDDCFPSLSPFCGPPPPPSGPDPDGFDRQVTSLAPALDSSDDIYVGGWFTKYTKFDTYHIARFNNNGSFDKSFVTGTGFNTDPETIAPATDGSGDVYFGGWGFWGYNGTDIFNIVRLNLDGTLDSTFDTGTGFNNRTGFNNNVNVIVPANDGSGDIYVGGNFTHYNDTDVGNGLIRLNSDGSIDVAFDTGLTGFDGFVLSIAVATDGSGDVYVGGSFTNYDGTAVNYITRLNNDGSLDSTFDTGIAGFNSSVKALTVAIDGSGDTYVGGGFSDYNGMGTAGIVRLNSDGSRDMGFTAGTEFEGIIEMITVATDGSGDIYADTKDKGQIARLNNDGSTDTGFDTGSGFSTAGFAFGLTSIVLAPDGSGDVYVGGHFSHYKSSSVDYLVRLTSGGTLIR